MLNIPVYERLVGENWVTISEDEFIDVVYSIHTRLTPIVKMMLAGNTWSDGKNIYRLTIVSE